MQILSVESPGPALVCCGRVSRLPIYPTRVVDSRLDPSALKRRLLAFVPNLPR